jgi:hypothetical protein
MKGNGFLLLALTTLALVAAVLFLRPAREAPAPSPMRQNWPRRDALSQPEFPPALAVPSGEPIQKHRAGRSRTNAVAAPKVTHRPLQPKSGEPVTITVDFKDKPVPSGSLLLEYQLVDPGRYIALRDPDFQKLWTSVPLSPAPAPTPDQKPSVLNVELPGTLQKHRRLIRYRIRAAERDEIIAPASSDAQPNFAYFVYDGVPAWKGAIDPRAGDSELRRPVTYSSEVLQRVPVYHFISSKSAVERVTWTGADQMRNRNAYYYTGTMVYDGIVYDHVAFRARGGGWRHAMGKNMWKFNFLPGHRFAARDDYGNRYATKWDKLNLGACIQQGDYGMRGEQGLFEAVGFRLFNLAGQEASRTHWVHFRILDEAEESPSDQYHGDFWGLYLAVENVDEHFLKEHDLPPGNLYKMEFGPKTEFNGDPAVTDQRDVRQFLDTLMRQPRDDSWWSSSVDLSRYYDYRSILECIHHYDVDMGKNYFFYLNPQTQRWIVIPWDIDLTWGEHMFGGGHEPYSRAGLLSRSPFKQQYQERLAEIRDLLFNPEETGRLIDEDASIIGDPAGGPSLVDADRAKWDYNPVMAGPFVLSMKAGQGRFYFGNPHNRFPVMVASMKSYLARRVRWIDSRLLGDYRPPPAPQIAKAADLDFSKPTVAFRLAAKAEDRLRACRWRLAEITLPNSPVSRSRQPWKYEIQALWEKEYPGNAPPAIPTQLLAPGHTYRVRARAQDTSGSWSRWSAPVQFTVPAP